MNRDAVLATIIGFAIGLTITGLFLIGPNISSLLPSYLKMPSFAKSTGGDSPIAEKSDQVSNPTGVSIESPAAESVIDAESVLVSGSAPPQSTIIIQGQSDEIVVVSGEDGKYAGKITVSEGKNEISVTGYTTDGKESSQSMIVYFTAEEL